MPSDPQPVAWALYEDGDKYDAVTQEEDAVAWRNRVPSSVATRTIAPLYAAPSPAEQRVVAAAVALVESEHLLRVEQSRPSGTLDDWRGVIQRRDSAYNDLSAAVRALAPGEGV